MALDELGIIDRFFRPLAGAGAFNLLDDAAQLDVPPGSDLVVTVDMIAEAIHFLPDDPPDTIARKALRVNVSDLAAKGARPLAYLLSLGLSRTTGSEWLAAFAAGLAEDQRRFSIKLLGGDTIDSGQGAVISITAFGLVPKGRMVHRSGAAPGDRLFVSGTIGGAGVGLALLRGEAGPWSDLSAADQVALVERYRVPEPRVALAAPLLEYASAAMDVSDGLVGDCDKLCSASGCSATILADSIPLPESLTGRLASEHVGRLITGGDDYEILAAVPMSKAAGFQQAAELQGVAVTEIGVVTPGNAPVGVLFEGRPLSLSGRAFAHGRGVTTS